LGTIAGVARQLGVHRRTVRQALASANPPARKPPVRDRPKLDAVRQFIDQILEGDVKAPRIYHRLGTDGPNQVDKLIGS